MKIYLDAWLLYGNRNDVSTWSWPLCRMRGWIIWR